MLTRDDKNFFSGGYFHIFNRGNGKANIFLDGQDYTFFLYRLKENLFPKLFVQKAPLSKRGAPSGRIYIRKSLPENAFTLLAYCLMPNHFHFLIRQNQDVSPAKLLGKVCTGYSIYFNKKYEHTGHVFQDRFKAVWVDTDKYLLWVSAYIHQNPKTAGLVKNLEDWQFSSFPDYLDKRKGILCDKNFLIEMIGGQKAYLNFVNESSETILYNKRLEEYLLDHKS